MDFVNLQLDAFLILFFTGMVLGGFFDLYRVFRSRIKVTKTVNLIGDLLFWIFTAVLVIPLIFWGTWLELRFFVWLAIGLGLFVYFTILSSILIPVFKIFWQIIGWLPGKLLNLLWRMEVVVQRFCKFAAKNNRGKDKKS